MSKKTKHAKKVAEAVIEGDGRVAEAVEPYAESATVKAIGFLSEIGDQPPMRALCVATIAAGAVSGSPRLLRTGVRMLAAHTVATWAKDFVKLRIDRTRPRTDKDHGMRPGKGKHKEVTSFPSGHTAGAVAVARAFARDFPEYRTPAYAAAAAVSLAQVPRNAHYPSDIGAGFLIGLGGEAAVSSGSDLLSRSLDGVGDIPVFDTAAPKP